MWLNLAKAVQELQRTYSEAFDSYRPELHYMRGPGPKWQAKRADLPLTADTACVLPTIANVHA
jgi:hypothetical protein